MLRKLLLSDIDIKSSHRDYRKLIAANFTIIFTTIIFIFFSTYNFILGNMNLFYMEVTLLIFVVATYLHFRKLKNIILIANMAIVLAFIGSILVVYFTKAEDYSPLWAFAYLFYAMILLGHKKGLLVSIVLFLLIYTMMWIWIGEHVTQYEFIRYIFISFVLVFISYIYEYSIHKSFQELEKANKTLTKISRVDSLTTLYNRKYFDEIFPKQIKIAKRNEKILIFAMMDIDYFKNYNDTYGHQDGDSVLKNISLSFKKSAQRPDDYVFRIGGEEFGILLHTQNVEDSIKNIEQIRTNIEDLKIPHSKSKVASFITISIGLYVINPDDKNDYSTIYKLCDDALYKAKNTGRNRVELVSKKI